MQVIYWYHRQFIETATDRYLHDDAFCKKCHLDIAHYFKRLSAIDLLFGNADYHLSKFADI